MCKDSRGTLRLFFLLKEKSDSEEKIADLVALWHTDSAVPQGSRPFSGRLMMTHYLPRRHQPTGNATSRFSDGRN
jgi:hypothetical protein